MKKLFIRRLPDRIFDETAIMIMNYYIAESILRQVTGNIKIENSTMKAK